MTAANRSTGVVIPVRAFNTGKLRLASRLTPDARAELAQRWATQVAHAAAGHLTVVVSSDDHVEGWARGRGLAVLPDPGSLDAAADAGRAWLTANGCSRVVVSHADLPRARSFAPVLSDGSQPVVVLVPCHRDDGTPVLSIPATIRFPFAYGPGSFRRHAALARRLGLAVRVVRDAGLGFDVDTPEDLDAAALPVGGPGVVLTR